MCTVIVNQCICSLSPPKTEWYSYIVIGGFVSIWGGEHFLTEDSSAPFTFIQLFLGEVKSCSDNLLSMTWKSIKGAVYKQLDEEAFYVKVSEWVAKGSLRGEREADFPF